MHLKHIIIYLGIILSFLACGEKERKISKIEISQVKMGEDFKEVDSVVYQLIQPYKEKMQTEMNEVIGELGMTLQKSPKVGTMGHMIADIIKAEGEYVLGKDADFAFINNGGMRIPDLQKGPLGLISVYEMLPFDNMVVMLTLDGITTKALIQYISQRNQDGISGISISEQGKKVLINGQDFDENRSYKILTIDFLYTGGDGFEMLADAQEVESTDLLLRNLVIQHVKKQEKPLMTDTQKRLNL